MSASLSELSEQWNTTAFSSLQEQLQSTAADIASKQEEAESGRRRLIDQCRSFKQSAADDVRKTVAPLMKSFQAEIDSLTSRSRTAETSILQLFDKLAALPDPSSALKEAVAKCQRLADSELETANLRRTLAQYNSEFADVKNQEVTVRQLRDQLKHYETSLQQQVEERSAERESVLRDMFEQRERELQESHKSLAAKAKEAERRADSVQKALEGAQKELFSLRSGQDEVTDARSEQIDMLNTELDRATQALDSAVREKEALQEQVQHMQQSKQNALVDDGDGLAENPLLEAELRAKDKHISKLLSEAKSTNDKMLSVENELRGSRDQHSTELTHLQEQITHLQGLVDAQHDYQQIKKELTLLKSIECGEDTAAEDGEQRPLEVMLLDKNRTLQSDNASLRQCAQSSQVNGADDVEGEKEVEDKLQTVLRSVECLIGAELVAGYNQALAAKRPRKQRHSNLHNTPLEHTTQANTGTRTLRHIEPKQLMVLKPTASNLQASQVVSAHHNGHVQTLLPYMNGNADKHMSTQNATAARRATKPHVSNDLSVVKAELNMSDGGEEEEAQISRELQHRLTAGVNERMHDMSVMDTTLTAATCKRLLAVHNLGQRLFARTLLGQSQGSLSELLAKPRCWDRLTDKGREAFRRIHAWVHDEHAIQLMAALSRKPNQRARQDNEHINLMHSPVTTNRGMYSETSQSPRECVPPVSQPHAPHLQATQPPVSQPPVSQPPVPINTSTQDDCLNMMVKSEPLDTLYPNAAGCSQSAPSQAQTRWRHDDIPREKIIEIYQRELSKIQDSNATPDTTASRKRTANDKGNALPIKLHATDMPLCQITQNGRRVSSVESVPESASSPRSVAADLRKSMLCELTDQDYDRFGHIDTEQLVGQIRDFLLCESISQRLFGEQILGLSQGSVSDMLARPRHWQSLTQKGREPFVRMSMFLQNPTAIERLRQQRAFELRPFNAQDEHNQSASNSPQVATGCEQLSQRILANAARKQQQQQQQQQQDTSTTPSMPMLNVNTNMDNDDLLASVVDTETELDTVFIANSVRDQLQVHGIGQKIFGESILGVSQGTVSDLLSKAKHWSQLSQRGREPYVRMQSWLDNPNKLQTLVRAAAKRSQSMLAQPTTEQSPAKKIQRTLVTDEQKRAMRFAYAHDAYPTVPVVDFLGAQLGLSSRTVTNWFYNQRCRTKLDAATLSRDLEPDLLELYPALHQVFTLQQPLPITDNTHNNYILNADTPKGDSVHVGDRDTKHNVLMDEDCCNEVLSLSSLFSNPLMPELDHTPLHQPSASPPSSCASKLNLLDKALEKIKMRAQQT